MVVGMENMATTRLIVKNLPNKVTELKIRELFGSRGTVTDVQLKYTPDGRFRQFCFIGFKSPEEAETARAYFDNTYIGASKINVQNCAKLGDPNKPRAWSKYAPDSSVNSKRKAPKPRDEEESERPAKKKKEEEILEKCREDPDFLEFLESHRKKSSWGNDTIIEELEKQTLTKKVKASKDKELSSKKKEAAEVEAQSVVAEKPKKTKDKSNESETENKSTENESSKKSKKKKSTTEAGDKESEESLDVKKFEAKKKKKRRPKKSAELEFILKLRDLPEKAKTNDIKEFFAPIVPKSIKLPKFRGVAYVRFQTEDDLKKAFYKNKSFLLGNRILIRKYDGKNKTAEEISKEKLSRWAQQTSELEKECETVGESGRIFIRNLSYTTNEEEMREMFAEYGPVTELHLPLDRLTRKIKGFGFVSFLLPEHATKAFNALDGTIFQGRMLHLLPAKSKDEISVEDPSGNSSFKKAKTVKQKKAAGSSHNWNTLFLGQNAVAQVVAEKYGVSREDFLLDKDDEKDKKQSSIAVRMALAEAEIVDETQNFLTANGVSLEAFENIKTDRSKTVMLVKNLQAKTVAQDLVDLFSKHGEIGRVVLPQSGVTAIIEFLEPAEARAAFKKLAYTNFGGMPLYLEWAPVDTFLTATTKRYKAEKEAATGASEKENTQSHVTPVASLPVPPYQEPVEEEEPIDEDMVPEPDTTLFVKNINFSTEEPAMKKHFRQSGPIYSVTIARKRDSKQPGKVLSMGYGFVQYYRAKDALTALKTLQGSMLENHIVELKKSNRTLQTEPSERKAGGALDDKKASSKLLVRNVPFQASQEEILQLFTTFGQIKACRLPLKMDGSGDHRGFAFIDFYTKAEAKRAFETLGKSTHLYGRRLVLEWAQQEETVDELRHKTAKKFELQTAGARDTQKTSTKKSFTRYFNAQPKGKKEEEDED